MIDKGNGNRAPDGIDRKLIHIEFGDKTRNTIAAFGALGFAFWFLGVCLFLWVIQHFGC